MSTEFYIPTSTDWLDSTSEYPDLLTERVPVLDVGCAEPQEDQLPPDLLLLHQVGHGAGGVGASQVAEHPRQSRQNPSKVSSTTRGTLRSMRPW